MLDVFWHDDALLHDTGSGLFEQPPSPLLAEQELHPENAVRVLNMKAILERGPLAPHIRWREGRHATEQELALVHDPAYVDSVRSFCESGGGVLTWSTPVSRESWGAALAAAGTTLAAADAVLQGESGIAYALVRPPGHHAQPAQADGYCLFSNVALAAEHARRSGLGRVAVLDWDVHHGNGTNAVFHQSREVLFASIHQYPFYPGTGPLSDAGTGEGEGFSINLPVPGGSGEDVFCGLVEHVVLPAARAFDPDLVLVSAGFDAHRADPVGGCSLESSSFAELTRQVLTLGKPVGCVLEGGYDLDGLATSVAATMEALTGDGTPGSHPRGPLVEEAAAAVGRYWELG
jgi:acetoin utilization deacetylase AcuC-like enzyme